MNHKSTVLFVISIALVVELAGCGGDDSGRHSLSGKVTFGGQPVPNGYLRFAPDKQQGNAGPGSSASIKDGRYETMPGRGTVGGPHIVAIVGTDGVPYKSKEGFHVAAGRRLFPEHEVRVELPKEPGEFDFEVPRNQAKQR